RRAGYSNTSFSIDVYSTGTKVTLYVNGVSSGSKSVDDIHKASYNITLKDGDNYIEAITTINGKTIKDAVTIHYTSYPEQLSSSPFSSIYINVGSNAQYTDNAGMVWLQDQPYKKGGYGFVSGVPATLNLKYMIKGTEHTPLHYSYLDSVTQYKVDVPDGNYDVDLFFIEAEKLKKGDRVFDVSINGQVLINDLDMADSYGFCQAVKKTFILKAEEGKGITISFNASKGKPVLSGVSISKK
ncbi:MAG: malectin domain-containing carbohydrate-binding protein, partial [Bacteroidota bacterium]|nr:malectin domain-containing carbohydrate-binding protein [Bacteroidota bacterium]